MYKIPTFWETQKMLMLWMFTKYISKAWGRLRKFVCASQKNRTLQINFVQPILFPRSPSFLSIFLHNLGTPWHPRKMENQWNFWENSKFVQFAMPKVDLPNKTSTEIRNLHFKRPTCLLMYIFIYHSLYQINNHVRLRT